MQSWAKHQVRIVIMSYLSLAVELHHLPRQDVANARVKPDQVPLAELR